jgi:hypothetical protein
VTGRFDHGLGFGYLVFAVRVGIAAVVGRVVPVFAVSVFGAGGVFGFYPDELGSFRFRFGGACRNSRTARKAVIGDVVGKSPRRKNKRQQAGRYPFQNLVCLHFTFTSCFSEIFSV